MNILDLFCGAGGFSKGFALAGHKIILGIDNWQIAIDNFRLNHPKAEVLLKDISLVDVKELPNNIDIIIGGTPCQEFTSLNLKKQPWRGMLNICHFFRIVEKYKPKYFVMENVIGIKKYLPSYLNFYVLKASDYGCKTARRRLFVTNISKPHPRNINFNPVKTIVAVDNRNKDHRNQKMIVYDLEDMKFNGAEKEIRQLQANCVLPKLAKEIALQLNSIKSHV